MIGDAGWTHFIEATGPGTAHPDALEELMLPPAGHHDGLVTPAEFENASPSSAYPVSSWRDTS